MITPQQPGVLTEQEANGLDQLNKAKSHFDLTFQRVIAQFFPSNSSKSTIDQIAKSQILIETTAAQLAPERQEDFYFRLSDLLTTFFEIEERSDLELTSMIRRLVNTVFPSMEVLQQGSGYESSESMFALKSSIQDRILELQKEEQPFDVKECLANIFQGENSVPLNTLLRRCEEQRSNFPPELYDALMRQIHGISKGMQRKNPHPQVPKKPIAKSLRSFSRRIASDGNQEVQMLRNAYVFINSLEAGNLNVTDFYTPDFLGDLDEASVRELTDKTSLSLPSAALKSRYNGKVLEADSFTLHARNQALSDSIIQNITPRDFHGILTSLAKVAQGELQISDIALRTGIGASDKDVPVRILSYVIPALIIARRFQNRYHSSPKVEFFTGEEGGISCNKMNPQKVKSTTRRAFDLADNFVTRFFPDVAEQFSLIEDREWTDPKVALAIDYFEQLILDEAASGRDLVLNKIVAELRRRGEVYGENSGSGNSLKYAAFHALCFQDIPVINSYIDPDSEYSGHTISLGGRAESEFNHIRDLLVDRFSIEGFNQFAISRDRTDLTIQTEHRPVSTRATILTNTGKIPPYFLVPEAADIGMEEVQGLGPEEIRRLFAERTQRALTIINQKSDNEARTVAGAQSFIQSMAVIAAAVGHDLFIDFVSQQNHQVRQK